jgi:hypothetical protein
MRMRRARAREEVQLAAALRESERLAVAHRAAPLTAAEEAASLEVAVRASLQLGRRGGAELVGSARRVCIAVDCRDGAELSVAAGRRSSSEESSEATRSGEDAPGNEAVAGSQAARARARRGGGGRAPSGGRAHSGGARSRLRERRGACTIIAQYGASHEGGCGRALITARCAKATVEECSLRRVARRRLWKSAQYGASHEGGCGRVLSTARRTKAAVEERQLVAAIEASLASRASWRGTADSDGRYTREVTRLACMQAEAATWACTGAPASHVAISRYGAQHGAWIPWWCRRGKRPRRAGDWTCHCLLHVAFSRPLSPDR